LANPYFSIRLSTEDACCWGSDIFIVLIAQIIAKIGIVCQEEEIVGYFARLCFTTP